MQIIIIVGLSMIFFSMNELSATTYPKLPSTSIDSLWFSGGTNIGDTCYLHTNLTSLVKAKFKVSTIFEGGIRALNQPDSIRLLETTQSIDSGISVEKVYPFIIIDTTVKQIAFKTNIENTPNFINYETMNIKQGNVLQGETIDQLECENPDEDDDNNVGYFSEDSYLTTPNENDNNDLITNFVIHGKVWFIDPTDSRKKGSMPRVRLYFRSKLNTTFPLRLSLPQSLANGYVSGVHYAECDTLGNYTFKVRLYKEELKNMVFLVFPEKENFAISLYSPACHIEIHKWGSQDVFKTFINYVIKDVSFSGNTVQNDVDIQINPSDGLIMRYASLSKYFIKRRFDVQNYADLPFYPSLSGDKVPIIQVKRMNSWNSPAGRYDGTLIRYITKYLSKVVVSHEFGHYLDALMASSIYNTGNSDNTEAFAMFFAQAFCAWNNGTFCNIYPNKDKKDPYGNIIINKGEEIFLPNNTEIAPSYKQWDIYINGYRNRGIIFSSNRAWLGDYEYSGAAYSCLLWNLYDMKCESDHKFTADCILSYKPY